MVQLKSVPSSTSAKVADKPKRPLSAYNLYFRFKRAKILEAHKAGDDSNEAINRLISAVPGLEEHPLIMNNSTMSREIINELSRSSIRSALLDSLSPKDTRNRVHRKSTLGLGLSFLEMNKIMVASWKSIEDDTRLVFEELAEEGRRMYKKRVAEYENKYGTSSSSSSPKKVKTASTSKIELSRKKAQANKIRVVKKEQSPAKSMFTSSAPMVSLEKKLQPTATHVSKPYTTNKQRLSSPTAEKISKKQRFIGTATEPGKVTTAAVPTNLTISHFDDMDLDLPPLDDTFEDDGSHHSFSSDENYCSVQSPSNVCELDDFPNLPFLPVPEGAAFTF